MLLATNGVHSEMSGCQEVRWSWKGAVQTPSERNEARRPSASASIASLWTTAQRLLKQKQGEKNEQAIV